MYKKYIKRLIDVILSFIGLLFLLPFFVIFAIIIKIESKGPVFFKQKRIGKNKTYFMIYKFRTMKTGRKELESNLSHDEMLTKVGKFIRKTR